MTFDGSRSFLKLRKFRHGQMDKSKHPRNGIEAPIETILKYTLITLCYYCFLFFSLLCKSYSSFSSSLYQTYFPLPPYLITPALIIESSSLCIIQACMQLVPSTTSHTQTAACFPKNSVDCINSLLHNECETDFNIKASLESAVTS